MMSRFRLQITPLVLYLALAIFMTWPLVLRFTTAVPGNAYDSWQNMWNFWWLRKALLEGLTPYFTPMLYYPQGASLLLHTLNPLNFFVSLPVHATLGLVAAYNFVVLFSLTMSGYIAYLLAHDVTGEPRAALVAGAIFAFSGYLLAQVMGGHTHMMAAWPLPLAVLALRKASRGRGSGVRERGEGNSLRMRWGAILLAGGALALNLLADWQYFLFALIWAGWYALALLVEERRLQALSAPTLAVAVALLLTAPLIVATARLAATVPTASTEGGADFRREQAVDLADLAIPSQLHPLWGLFAEQLQSYKAQTHIQNKTAYLGLVAVLLAAAGLRRREGRFWLLSGLVFVLLAMGPVFQAAGWNSGLPLPGALLFELPLVRIFRYPVRFMALAMLALAMLAGLGAARILHDRSRSRQQLITVGLIALIMLDNLTLPFPMVGIYIPPVYAEMAGDGEQYAVLEAPFYYFSSPVYMLYQAVHDKPLVGGYLSRRLPYRLLDELPIIRQFAFAAPAPDIVGQEPERIAASIFDYFNIRYLLLHSDGGALRYGEMLEVARAAAGGAAPIEQGATVAASDARSASGLVRSAGFGTLDPAGSVLIYKVAPPAEPLPFLGVGTGWGAPQPDGNGGATRLLAADEATLTAYSTLPRRVLLELQLRATTPGELRLRAGNTQLPAQPLAAGPQTLHIALDLAAGETTLLLRPTGAGTVVVERADFGNGGR